MSKQSDTEEALHLPSCEATITWPGGELPATLDVKCNWFGRVVLSGTVPYTHQVFALRKFFGSRQLFLNECSVVATAESGQSFRTEHASLTSWKEKHERGTSSTFTFELDCTELIVSSPSSETGPEHYEYLVGGLRCSDVVAADFDFGEVQVRGVGERNEHRPVAQVNVIPKGGLTPEQVDAGVDRVLDILSLATGRMVRWCIRKRIVDQAVETYFFTQSPLDTARWAVFHHRELGPILSAAALTLTQEFNDKAGVGVAIRWMLAHSDYESVRFVQLMTALEHLIEKARERIDLFPKPIFKEICNRLRETVVALGEEINQRGTQYHAEFSTLHDSIEHLNQRVLKKRIRSLLKLYAVPSSGLDERIDGLVNLRNDLVHQGIKRPNRPDDIMESEATLRELLVRVLLAMLKFEGTYRSWREGPTSLLFPSLNSPS